MRHHDEALKMYADSGLRTAEDWATMGREIKDGATARAEAVTRGKAIAVFGRDQTRQKTKTPGADR